MSFVIRLIIRQENPVIESARADVADAFSLLTGGFVSGPYLKWSNPDAMRGDGEESWTDDIIAAKHFESLEAAMKCWKAQSKVRPLRPDGKPNRPMTAYSVEIEEVP